MSGGKGGGNTPPDSELRNIAIPLPELRKPVQNAIAEANQQFGWRDSHQDAFGYGPNVVQPWNWAQNTGYMQGLDTAMNRVGGILNPAASLVSRVGGGEFVGNSPGQGTLNAIAGGQYLGNTPGQGVANAIAHSGPAAGQKVFGDLAHGRFETPATDTLRGLMGQAAGGSGALDMIRNTASGAMLGGNPNLDNVINDQARSLSRNYGDAVAGIEGRMSAAGRLGSNAEMDLQGRAQENLAQGLGDLENRVRYQDYANERGLQQQAQLALPGAFATDINTGVGAANAAGADQWQKLQTMLSGANSAASNDLAARNLNLAGANSAANIFQNSLNQTMAGANSAGQLYQNSMGQALQGAGMAPQQAAAQFMAPDRLLQYGGMSQAQTERQAQEAQNALRYGQDYGWNNLSRYIQALQGAAGMTNMQGGQPQPQQPGTSPVGDIAQLIGSGAMLVGAFCDQRVKTDVERLADLPSGAGWYRFRYRWDEPGTVRFGPMAQELREFVPEAVANVGGVLMVDLAKVA